jgi:hypothetical protein
MKLVNPCRGHHPVFKDPYAARMGAPDGVRRPRSVPRTSVVTAIIKGRDGLLNISSLLGE